MSKLSKPFKFAKGKLNNFIKDLKSLFAKPSPEDSVGWQNHLDKKLVFSLSQSKIPKLKQLKYLGKFLSKKELWLLRGLVLLITISLIFLGLRFYLNNFLPTPIPGGEYVEGLIGAPQYINPLLCQTNDVDMDISRLIFSGLLKYDKQLNLVVDLAEKYEISEDQKTYTFYLRKEIKWHDNHPLDADDVVFTVQSIQDPNFKSPLLASLRGVELKKIDDFTIQFILPEPFAPFLEVLTFGILPEHIWLEIPPINANLTEYNLKPIGTGPWQFKNLSKDKLGNIKSYTIVRNQNFYGQKPYLEKITFKFYPDFEVAVEALKNKSVEGISFLPKELKTNLKDATNLNYYSFYLPQYTAVFFNQKQNEILKEKNVRKALTLAVNKAKILDQALKLEGEIIEGPILPGFIGHNPEVEKIPYDLIQANQILDQAGWNKITAEEYKEYLIEKMAKEKEEAENTEDTEKSTEGTEGTEESSEPTTTEEIILESEQEFYRQKGDKILEITLTTVKQPENVTAANLIKEGWENIGVKVNLQIIEGGKISREIIKPRAYDALLYGEIVGADPDPYPFWHSSQIQDPGLNLAIFANRDADKLLEEARKTTDPEQRELKHQEFQNILASELPAIFLYNPTYTYALDQKIKGLNITRVIVPSDRFNNLEEWYIKTKREYKTE